MPQSVEVPGVRPDSLLGYLKAIGLLSLSGSKGKWERDRFYLEMDSLEALTSEFLENYEPKPIANPWNKDSGFQGKGSLLKQVESLNG